MIQILTQLWHGIPVYMLIFMGLVLLTTAIALYLSIPNEPER